MWRVRSTTSAAVFSVAVLGGAALGGDPPAHRPPAGFRGGGTNGLRFEDAAGAEKSVGASRPITINGGRTESVNRRPNGNAVAFETIVIQHEGMQNHGRAPYDPRRDRFAQRTVGASYFNPKEIAVEKQVPWQRSPPPPPPRPGVPPLPTPFPTTSTGRLPGGAGHEATHVFQNRGGIGALPNRSAGSIMAPRVGWETPVNFGPSRMPTVGSGIRKR